jgi:hypothetical protein
MRPNLARHQKKVKHFFENNCLAEMGFGITSLDKIF